MKLRGSAEWRQGRNMPKWAENGSEGLHPEWEQTQVIDIEDLELSVEIQPPPLPVRRMASAGTMAPSPTPKHGCHGSKTPSSTPHPKVDPVLLDEVRCGLKGLGLSKSYAEAQIAKVLGMKPVPTKLEDFLIHCLRK